MALLINKLFSTRKKANSKHRDESERLFNFSQDQVRVILFRECDFRGRKLLFDSQSVQKVPVPLTYNKNQMNTTAPTNKSEILYEVSNGYGFQYQKASSDVAQLGEMVFGCVAMSYRGTSFKIHSFSSPAKLMCTQVFPSPRHSTRARVSVTSHNFDALRSNNSMQSLEKSAKFDCSSTSSTTSFTEHTSVHSTESDLKVTTVSGSFPLDVPVNNLTSTKLPPSLEGDSGFCGEQSYSSVSSGPPSMSLWDTQQELASIHGFSCGSLYKRWLRSASTSLDYNISDTSLTGVHQHPQTSASADECITRSQHRSSKLGLAVIIQLTEGQEMDLERFLLEHSALIESMVFRAKCGAETAYLKIGSFITVMYDIYKEVAAWLTELINGPIINTYYWHLLASSVTKHLICDTNTRKLKNNSSRNSVTNSAAQNKTKSRDTVNSHSTVYNSALNPALSNSRHNNNDLNNGSFNNSSLNGSVRKSDMTKTKSEGSLVKTNSCNLLHNDNRTRNNLLFSSSLLEIDMDKNRGFRFPRSFLSSGYKYEDKSSSASSSKLNNNNVNSSSEKFIRELCELLETVDAKHTNFFISTLLTAVLTNHLGWVATTLPPTDADKETVSRLRAPCNPLWGQLSDLYGAVGSPTKLSHTIICGNNKNEIITKILNVLTYFIRCSIVNRQFLNRHSSTEENLEADNICQKDILAKISSHSNTYSSKKQTLNETHKNIEIKTEELEMSTLKIKKTDENLTPKSNLTRTKSYRGSLNIESKNMEENEDFSKAQGDHPLLEKVTSLGLSAANLPDEKPQYQIDYVQKERDHLIDIQEASDQIRKVFQSKNNKLNKNVSHSNLTNLNEHEEKFLKDTQIKKPSGVIFVLGENEELVGLNKTPSIVTVNSYKTENNNNNNNNNNNINIPSCSKERPADLKIPLKCSKKLFTCSSDSDSSPEFINETSISGRENTKQINKNNRFTLSSSPGKVVMTKSSVINLESDCDLNETRRRDDFNRSQSVPPFDKNQRKKCTKIDCKRKKYAGVKIDLKQYPQIFTNYMKSKNIELSQLSLTEKTLKLNRSFSTSLYDCSKFDFVSNCDCESSSEGETLQTPSNASELEFSSEDKFDFSSHRTRDKIERRLITFTKNNSGTVSNKLVIPSDKKTVFKSENSDLDHPLRTNVDAQDDSKENNAIFQHDVQAYDEQKSADSDRMVLVELPMPRVISRQSPSDNIINNAAGYTQSLLRSVSSKYVSDMVLQGTVAPLRSWEHLLRRDLALAARHPLLDQPIQEAVAIIANTDTWEVQLMSSHTYVVERGSSAVRVGMSQLVANMLESLLHMCKLRAPAEYCLMYIESRLRELCARSRALAQLLMATEFCNMDLLTTTLQLEANDVPLLMAIASTHTPQLTHKYGLSFQ